ncbi:uncharacterized protein OCT59_010188 [Rhizophagus irregularis]|uniref:non-specific serine/threonine protein kinase n=5 Tax=Rhizophagus irregularis TaxID=588596 RepID=A0A015IBY4_RHIIW|nr:Bck1p [Rhizophagus irregularis DAOM 197198w]UZO18880.1 hypothetical protein OCT59_010188 [Rhizophagus irregularis]GBC38697.1 kinase-like domain-containing protein [Rhizophagus irregularis DAOM 181602=DAOM 197198]
MPYQFISRETKGCPDCKKPWISFRWCKDCETNSMKGNFDYWTSGNKEIDELIRHTQLSTSQACDYLEWFPFDNFEFVKYNGSGEFNSIYSAIWMEGPRSNWNNTFKEWTRTGPIKVALKRLGNSLNMSSSYVDRIKMFHKYIKSASLAETFGITRDPTSNYMIVMKYYENGNLYQYLDRHGGVLSWKVIIDLLREITSRLEKIHFENKIHGNLHGGNLLVEDEMIVRIGDLGIYGPSYINFENRNLNQIYGVLPYIAPEMLRGENITIASDIYSFGIIMYTFAAGKRPWYNRAHNISLAKDICDGKRLEIPGDTPDFYAKLMKQCWDNDPDKRPNATELYGGLNWINLIRHNPSPFDDNYYISEENRCKSFKPYTHPEIHPEAYYTSKFFHFPELIKHDH